MSHRRVIKVHSSFFRTWCGGFTTHADGLGPGGSLTPAKFTATSLAVVWQVTTDSAADWPAHTRPQTPLVGVAAATGRRVMTHDRVHSHNIAFIQSDAEWHSKGTPILGVRSPWTTAMKRYNADVAIQNVKTKQKNRVIVVNVLALLFKNDITTNLNAIQARPLIWIRNHRRIVSETERLFFFFFKHALLIVQQEESTLHQLIIAKINTKGKGFNLEFYSFLALALHRGFLSHLILH